MCRRVVLCFVLVIAFSPTVVFSQQLATPERIEALIEQLASRNPAPREVRGSEADYPARYDRSLQKPVFQAYRELNAIGVRAFPSLIEHFDDRRYSLTADAGPMDKNFRVGELCYYLVELQLQPDRGWTVGDGDPRFRTPRPHYPTHNNLRKKGDARKWWEANKEQSLLELQIAVTEWTIAEEAKAPSGYSKEERETLQARLRELRTTGKPFASPVPWFK